MKIETIITEIDAIKTRWMKAARKTENVDEKDRLLQAALDLHRVATRLEQIQQTIVPFQLDTIDRTPSPNQRPLFDDTSKVFASQTVLTP